MMGSPPEVKRVEKDAKLMENEVGDARALVEQWFMDLRNWLVFDEDEALGIGNAEDYVATS